MATRVLVVEDEAIIAEDIRACLINLGYEVSAIVDSGEEAIQRVETDSPDLVLMDIVLRGEMDGIEAAKRIRSCFSTPLIFLTATGNKNLMELANQTDVNGYLIKPFEEKELRATIEIVLYKHSMERQLAKSEEKFQKVFEYSNDAIFVIDPRRDEILEVNPTACHMLGFTQEELLSKHISDIYPDEMPELKAFIQSVFEKGKGWTDILTCRTKDGKLLPAEISASVIDSHGRTCILALVRDITDRKQAEKSIHQMSYYDQLTGLPNRANLIERLETILSLEQDKNKRFAFFIINLNRLKDVNAALGFECGDLLLQRVGRHLFEIFGPTTMVARLDRDEFGMFLAVTGAEEVILAANKVLELFREPFRVEGFPLYIEASIGIAISPDHGRSANPIFQKADVALNEAKQSGSGFNVYSPLKDKHSPQRLSMMGELHHAINDNQLILHYQPKLNLRTGKISGVEALVRWQHPKWGMVPPDQFILPAEQTGLIKPLTRWVLNEALSQCHQWEQSGKKIRVAVNLAIRNIQDPQLPDQIEEFLQKFDVSPSSLEVEVTEGTIMTDEIRAKEVLNKLTEKGISISIDDFGKGHSSLTCLRKLPAGTIKIDNSFVLNMMANKDDAAIVRSTITLGHNLGLKVTAEGVEDREVLDRLVDLGCDEAQGYYIARPFCPSKFDKELKEMRQRGGWTLVS